MARLDGDAGRSLPVCQNDSAIVFGSFKGRVPFLLVVPGSATENGKFLLHVAVQRENDRQRRHEHIGDEGVDDCGKGCSETVSRVSEVTRKNKVIRGGRDSH